MKTDNQISISEIEAIGKLTIELTKLRQNECKHLCIENFAPGCFHALLTRLVAVQQGVYVWNGQHPPFESEV